MLIEDRLAFEEEQRKKEKRRLEEINAKRNVRHPNYPWLFVDMRDQREIEETRKLVAHPAIVRLARKAKKIGRSFEVKKDSDGAFRLGNRMDEAKT